jgi:hypothetical protein
MRNTLLIASVGVLSGAAWPVSLDAGGQVRGSAPGVQQRRLELEVPIRRHAGGGGRTGRMFFALEYETLPNPNAFSVEVEPGPAGPGTIAGGAETGAPEQFPQHVVSTSSHPGEHVSVGIGGESVTADSATPGGVVDDAGTGAGTAQPNPTANPVFARPPGAAGPGRRISGWSGPGMPGPGRPARLPL